MRNIWNKNSGKTGLRLFAAVLAVASVMAAAYPVAAAPKRHRSHEQSFSYQTEQEKKTGWQKIKGKAEVSKAVSMGLIIAGVISAG